MRSPPLPLLAGLLLVVGCPKPVPVPHGAGGDSCVDGIEAAFGPQRSHVVALRPRTTDTVFDPAVLEAVDRVTAELEAAQTAEELSIKSIATVPLMTSTGGGAAMETIREQLPTDAAGALRSRTLLYQYEFAAGDTLDATGGATFVSLPAVNFAGADVDALVARVAAGVADTLEVALDGTAAADRAAYREVAGDAGPSADTLWIVLTAPEDGSIRDPEFLHALEALQLRLEALPEVAGTYALTDDVKLARRAAHRGDPAAAVLPDKRGEVSQLLMLMEMSGNATAFGRRVSDDGASTLLRVTLPVLGEQARAAVVEAARQGSSEGFPPGTEVQLCAG